MSDIIEENVEQNPVQGTGPEKQRVNRKHTRFFDSYINRTLKNVSGNEITNNARQQLNSVLIHFTRIASENAVNYAEITKKKTVSIQEIRGAVELMFGGKLQELAVAQGVAAVQTYEEDQKESSEKTGKKTKSRQTRAGIVFPPSVIERFLRNFGYSKIMITNTAPVFLAAVVEFFTVQILEGACEITKNNRKVRITVRDLELATGSDAELKEAFLRNRLSFVGGGVVPHIHPFLLKRVPKPNGKNGSTAVKEIKKYQKTGDCLMFARHPFEMIVREICGRIKDKMKISKDVFVYLQYIIEQRLVNILQLANNLTVYSKRLKVFPMDIEMVLAIQGNRMPKFFDNANNDAPAVVAQFDEAIVDEDTEDEIDSDSDEESAEQ
jgi:histone H2A